MTTPAPFFSVRGTPSWAPSPGDNEVTSLQKINGLLSGIAGSSTGSSTGHFDSSGNPRIFDSVRNGYYTLTAPNGLLTLSAFSTSP